MRTAASHMTWEYKVLDARSLMTPFLTATGLAQALSDLGAEGWEVFSGPWGEGWFFLKRPVPGTGD